MTYQVTVSTPKTAPPPLGQRRRIYLAARYSRRGEMTMRRAQLEDWGHMVTSEWIDGQHEVPKDASEEERERLLDKFARIDRIGVEIAQWLIIFGEEPRTPTRGGRNVELGIALAMGKRITWIGPREHVFSYLREIEWFPTWDRFVQFGHRW